MTSDRRGGPGRELGPLDLSSMNCQALPGCKWAAAKYALPGFNSENDRTRDAERDLRDLVILLRPGRAELRSGVAVNIKLNSWLAIKFYSQPN
jgi:hypothetical protein